MESEGVMARGRGARNSCQRLEWKELSRVALKTPGAVQIGCLLPWLCEDERKEEGYRQGAAEALYPGGRAGLPG